MISSRSQTFITQAFLILDAVLVYWAFWVGSGLRVMIRDWLGMQAVDEGLLESMNWLLYVCVPFLPLLLERLGFYERMRQKTTRETVRQLLWAVTLLVLLVGVVALVSRDRWAPWAAGLIAALLPASLAVAPTENRYVTVAMLQVAAVLGLLRGDRRGVVVPLDAGRGGKVGGLSRGSADDDHMLERQLRPPLNHRRRLR